MIKPEAHLGYGFDTTAGFGNYYKSGPENINGREYSFFIVLFSYDAQLAMMTTLHVGLNQIAWAAFKEWYR